jgi:FkbM family methyltransferase
VVQNTKKFIRKIVRSIPAFLGLCKSFGLRAAVTLVIDRALSALGFSQTTILRIKPRQAKYPVLARLGRSSDMSLFHEIFTFDEYACIRDISPARVILDLGANVGYSSAYLLSCFPTAKVVAVEPDPDNFELCRKNLAPYGDRAQVVLGAVWSKRCKLALSRGTFGDGREWATQVRESEGKDTEATVEAWDVPGLLHLAGGESIDLLKVDVERSELEIFSSSSSSWLPKVRNICIELHGDDCREVFLGALKEFEYDSGISRELMICRNLQFRTSSAQPE